jgi:hypothetical protein
MESVQTLEIGREKEEEGVQGFLMANALYNITGKVDGPVAPRLVCSIACVDIQTPDSTLNQHGRTVRQGELDSKNRPLRRSNEVQDLMTISVELGRLGKI